MSRERETYMDHPRLNPAEDAELSLISLQLARIAEQFKLVGESRPRRMTIPAIFGRSGDENFISDYLAYIVDPKRNGVGIEPLQALLSLAYENITEIKLDAVAIRREYIFGKNPNLGRIDFVIELGEDGAEGVIGIENKIYASEGESQTSAYAQGLKSDYPGRDLYCIYLTPSGRLPLSLEFKAVSYTDMLRSLREIRYPVLGDIHKTVIWEDFLAHLEEYIVMNQGKLELSGRTRLYLDHREMMEKLANAYEVDAQKVYDVVTGSIKNNFGEDWHFSFLGRNSFQEINRDSWEMGKFYLFYQFFFSRDTLLSGDQFSLMVGAYPKNAESRAFTEWLRVNRPEITEICARNEMEDFPAAVKGTGSYIFAYKQYPLVLETDHLETFHLQFIEALKEFEEFTPIIDQAVQAYIP